MTGKRWYVVHAYWGFEKNVAPGAKKNASLGLSGSLEEYFGQVLVPTEEVVEMSRGSEATHARAQVLPGLCSGRNGVERRHVALGEEHSRR